MAGYTPLPDGVPGSPPDTAFAPPIQAEYVQQRGVWDRSVVGSGRHTPSVPRGQCCCYQRAAAQQIRPERPGFSESRADVARTSHLRVQLTRCFTCGLQNQGVVGGATLAHALGAASGRAAAPKRIPHPHPAVG